MGASHQYAINDFHAGDETMVYHAMKLAMERSSQTSYVSVGLPNGNFNEFLAIYLSFREAKVLPDWLLVGVVYDDLREPGVRPSVLESLPDLNSELLEKLGSGGLNLAHELEVRKESPIERNATAGTPQARLEDYLISRLEQYWGAFPFRHNVAAYLVWQWKRQVFSVGEFFRRMGNPPKRVPPVPPDMMAWNSVALESLVSVARSDGVNLILYQVPHPQSARPFYHVRERYDAFLGRISERSREENFHFLDLETLVPLEYWMVGTAMDPWHFSEPGHRLVAEQIDRFMEIQELH